MFQSLVRIEDLYGKKLLLRLCAILPIILYRQPIMPRTNWVIAKKNLVAKKQILSKAEGYRVNIC
jgi:hypothetical protein